MNLDFLVKKIYNMTITIESKNIDLINSIFLLLKGNKELTVQVNANEDNTASEGLDFDKFDVETQQSVLATIADYRNGKKNRYYSLEEAFPDVVQTRNY